LTFLNNPELLPSASLQRYEKARELRPVLFDSDMDFFRSLSFESQEDVHIYLIELAQNAQIWLLTSSPSTRFALPLP